MPEQCVRYIIGNSWLVDDFVLQSRKVGMHFKLPLGVQVLISHVHETALI